MSSKADAAFEEFAKDIVVSLEGRVVGRSALRALFEIGFVAGQGAGLETAEEITADVRRYCRGEAVAAGR